jgi:hypothetical protein
LYVPALNPKLWLSVLAVGAERQIVILPLRHPESFVAANVDVFN